MFGIGSCKRDSIGLHEHRHSQLYSTGSSCIGFGYSIVCEWHCYDVHWTRFRFVHESQKSILISMFGIFFWVKECKICPCKIFKAFRCFRVILGLIKDISGSYVGCIFFLNACTFVTISMYSIELTYTWYRQKSCSQQTIS